MALLRYTSARFTPRLNDYTYSERAQRRPTVAQRIVRGTRESTIRSGSAESERADARR